MNPIIIDGGVQDHSAKFSRRARQEKFAAIPASYITRFTTLSQVLVFSVVALHHYANGARVSRKDIQRESGVSQSRVYAAITQLKAMHMLTESGGRFWIVAQDVLQPIPTNGNSVSRLREADSHAWEHHPLYTDNLTDNDGETSSSEDEMGTKITNVSATSKPAIPPTHRALAQDTGGAFRPAPTPIPPPPSPNPFAAHIEKLTGAPCEDAWKFARATPSHTDAEWMALIDEAWKHRERLCANGRTFKAASVITFAKYPDSYRVRSGVRSAAPLVSKAEDVERQLVVIEREREDSNAVRMLRNCVSMHGLSRQDVHGKVRQGIEDAVFGAQDA